MNTVVSLQKDVALVSVLGVREAVREAQIYTSRTFNYTSYVAATVLFLRVLDPARPPRRPLHDRRDRARRTPVARVTGARSSELDGVAQALRRPKVVLDGIDLTVAEHEVVCLIGPSGCGKSTLLRCIDLLDPIDGGPHPPRRRGDHRPRGERQHRAPPHRHRVPVVQPVPPPDACSTTSPSGPARSSACRRPTPRPGPTRSSAASASASTPAEYPDRLSGGQQQRVAIARALVTEPELLLLDEVTSALDPELVGEVLAAIRDLAGEGMTMVLATHEMGFARDVADRVCFLHDGRVLEAGPPAQVLGDPVEARTQQFLRRVIEAGRL